MAKMINYGDSLFVLSAMVRNVRDALQLEAEASVFFDKLVEDVFFVESALDKFFESLQASPLLIDRNEHLKTLMRAENELGDLLDGLVHERYRLSEEFRPFHSRFNTMIESRRARAAQIKAAIEKSEPLAGENGDMISPAEYEFLLVDKESNQEGEAETETE